MSLVGDMMASDFLAGMFVLVLLAPFIIYGTGAIMSLIVLFCNAVITPRNKTERKND